MNNINQRYLSNDFNLVSWLEASIFSIILVWSVAYLLVIVTQQNHINK